MERRLPLMKALRPEDSFIFGEKDGTRIDKGVLLNEDYLISIEEQLAHKMEYYSAYPDLFLDEISPESDDLSLFFYQRILLRALMRFKEVYWTACVLGNTTVICNHKEKEIKDIQKGDYVLTHLGWRKVLNTDKFSYTGNSFTFYLNNDKKITCTDDHLFLIKRKNFNNPIWIEAWAIQKDDIFLNKKNDENLEEEKEIKNKNSLLPYSITKLKFEDYQEININKIETSYIEDTLMYTLIVDDAESYISEGVISHNCRATSKTFLSIIALKLQCIFMPGTKRFIVATYKVQAAKIAKEKISEIFQHWPLLRREVVGGDTMELPGNYGKDYITLKYRNGSQLDVVGGDGTRGLRRNGGLLDELRDADEVEISEIVLPLMNVARRLPDNTVNSKEVNAQQIVMTSAGVKTSFAYDKLIDMFENSIIDPQNSFVIGMDYRIPIMHDLLDKQFIKKLKSSPSFNEESFAREYRIDMYSLNYC